MRRYAAVVVVGAALLVLPACGGKTDETKRAAGITPANAVAFLSVNLDPSIDQKRNLLSIARRFPDAREEVQGEFEDARDGLLAELVEDTGLDFERDVEPWLGNEVALAVLPPAAGDDPQFVAMIESDDEAKAKAALDKAATDEDFTGAYRVLGDFVVVTEGSDDAAEKAALDQIAAQSERDSGDLATSDAFNDVVDELAGDRLLLAWVDMKKVVELAGDLGEEFGAGLGPLGSLVDQATTVALDVHVENAAVVLQGVAASKAGGDGATPELTRSLPAGTLAALTLFDVARGATEGLEAIAGLGTDILADIEEQTGLNLQEDLLSWMGGELVLTVGPVAEGTTIPSVALVVEPTDRARAEQAVEKIRRALSDQGFELDELDVNGVTGYVVPQPFTERVQPAMALFDDRFVLATDPEYLKDLAGGAGAKLADSDAYGDALPDGSGENTTMQLVALIDPIRETIERLLLDDPEDRAGYEADVKPNIEPLSALGMVAEQDGDFARLTVKVTFDD
jgi:hypothetical protein